MNSILRVIVADDHPIVREGLRMVLEMAEDIELAAEASDGMTVLRLVDELRPDVVLMDVRMPGMDGLEALACIRQNWPQVAVLILTTYNEDELMIRGLQTGASGYLLKDIDVEDLLDAIRTAAQGKTLAQPEVLSRILKHAAHHLSRPRLPFQAENDLTEREQEVLAAIVRGAHTKEIAAQLHIAERTVRSHLTSIYTKLGVDSRTAAVAVALERGLLHK